MALVRCVTVRRLYADAPAAPEPRKSPSEPTKEPEKRHLGGCGRPGRCQKIGLVAELPAQPGVTLAPRLETPADRVEQPGLVRGLFLNGRPAEKTGAQLCIPADVVPPAHLILEEPRQHQALRAS